jgi:Double zinc ribbon
MKCPSCGHDNRAAAKFCRECAAPLAHTTSCPKCGTPSERGQKFCDSCGQPIAEAADLPLRPDPRSYTPTHLAEKILTSRSALEGERKQVTVLFADVKGSMDLAEQVDPEEWHRILDRFFQILSDGVHRFEGTVNQYTGDGIMRYPVEVLLRHRLSAEASRSIGEPESYVLRCSERPTARANFVSNPQGCP